jgi:uncharacterized membrane protein
MATLNELSAIGVMVAVVFIKQCCDTLETSIPTGDVETYILSLYHFLMTTSVISSPLLLEKQQ